MQRVDIHEMDQTGNPNCPITYDSNYFSDLPKLNYKWHALSINVDLPVISDADIWTIPILLNGMFSGTSYFRRVGLKIRMLKLEIRLSIYLGVGVGGVSNTLSRCRIVIFYDKQTNGTLPVVHALNEGVLAYGSEFSPINPFQSERFVILMDAVTENESTINSSHFFQSINIDLPEIFKSNGDQVADIATGGLYMTLVDLNGVTDVRNHMYGISRIMYTDV